ncbi:MAG: AmmeMemoRadiSam system protein B, partial [Planctomycetes bacterium]|nr:AmmeMemoRadiSam system protein B [Planctomycetota bacterium]
RTSAVRTADDDHRFPPISPSELAYLDVEVSVLFGRQQVTARGEDRLGVVEIGKHGLQIAHGKQRGLLLPQVATEGGLDAEQFLRHVCLKAGLPSTAWKQDAAVLWTFEGIVFGGPLAEAVELPEDVTVRPKFIGQDLTALANYCRDNLLAMARGATPNYYVTGVPDGNVSGIAIDLSIDGQAGSQSSCRLKLRGALPAQSTLFEMAREMAKPLAARPGRLPTEEQIELGIAILGDVALHGTVAEPDLRGVEPWRRAVMVRENKNMAWIYDPDKSADELLAAASKAARVRNPQAATVMSLDVSTNEPTFHIVQVARPVPGPSARSPGVAGKFYPDDPAQLSAMLDDLFSGDAPATQRWPAAMVPHAGLTYSGRIAADVLRRVEIPETVIIIGPKHTPLGVEWAVTPHATWSLPGIELAADQDLAEKLAHKIDGLELDALAHQQEHAIEVELPLIARLNPAAKVVGIAIGSASLEQCQKFAEQFSDALADRRGSTLLLISSDMNHFASDEENRRLDEIALRSLETLDPAAAFETVTANHISMCGLRPAVIVLETLRRWGCLAKTERVAYSTSAEASGDKSRVVGYAGMLFG